MTIVRVMLSCCFRQAVSASAEINETDTALSVVQHYAPSQTHRLVHARTRRQALSPQGNKPPGSFV